MSAASIEANKSLYFRFATLLGDENLEALDEVLASGFVDHSLPEATRPGAAGLRDCCGSLLRHVPDLHLTLEDLIAESDRVAARVFVHGTSSTGRVVSIELIDIVRIAEGLIVERWSQHSGCTDLHHLDTARPGSQVGAPRTESQGKEDPSSMLP